MPDSTLLIGLDVGGSTTRLRGEYADPADPSDLIERRGPGANPNREGRETAVRTLVDLITDALPAAAPDRLVLCAGVAGAGRADEQSALAEALQTALDAPQRSVQVEVVHDGQIALDAAYDAESGVIVIAGTGSLVLARTDDGTLHRAGGWGPVLGDPGSGHALGRAGLRAVAAALDGGPETDLQMRLRDAYDIAGRDQLLTAVYRNDLDVAAVAPLVLDAARADDDVATRLLTDETDALADLVAWLARRVSSVSPRVRLLGGLVDDPLYARTLRRALSDHVPVWSVDRLEMPPVMGALWRARRCAEADGAAS